MAATIDVGGGHLLERYYHHLFTTDRHIAALCDELGLEIEWRPSSVAMFARGRQWPFTTPGDLLRFKPLPPLSRVRMGAAVVALQRLANDRAPYERIDRSGVDREVDGQGGVARGVGPDAARQVRRPRRRDRHGLALEQAAAAARGGRARGEARLSDRLVAAAARGAARPDRGARRAGADRPPGGPDRARPRGDLRRARLVPRRPRPALRSSRPAASATTACSPPCPTTSSRG